MKKETSPAPTDKEIMDGIHKEIFQSPLIEDNAEGFKFNRRTDNTYNGKIENDVLSHTDELVDLTNEIVVLPDVVLRDFNTIREVIEESKLFTKAKTDYYKSKELKKDNADMLEVLKELGEDSNCRISATQRAKINSLIKN